MRKNEYCGNFFLCNKWSDDLTKIEGLYDTITLESLQGKVSLNIAVFLNGIIEESEDVAFVFILQHHNKDKKQATYLPLVFRNESMKAGENFMEATVLDRSEVVFPEVGTYSIELFVHHGKIEMDDDTWSNFKEILNECDFLNRYMLKVQCENS